MALHTKSKSSLFLIEMIIVILVFSLASAICASLFVNARLTSLKSTQLTMAVTRCQNAVEAVRAVGDAPDALEELLGAETADGGVYVVYYDADGIPTQSDGARYLLTISTSRDAAGLVTATATMTEIVTVAQEDEAPAPIYSLESVQYQP